MRIKPERYFDAQMSELFGYSLNVITVAKRAAMPSAVVIDHHMPFPFMTIGIA
jgi:hypothetical protein